MYTPKGLHYRRTHTPVPLVDEQAYRVSIFVEGEEAKKFSMAELRKYPEREIAVTMMCTGNRRSEFNTERDGETMGLPWKNGSISTAKWAGARLCDVLRNAGFDGPALAKKGYRFLTLYGIEDYHVSIPVRKAIAEDGDVILAWSMNGAPLPRDHGFPLRMVIPGLVGARSVKWIDRLIFAKEEVDGMHQKGIAYKQLGPNVKKLMGVPKEYITDLPPIDHVPITSAVTMPEPVTTVSRGEQLTVCGYAYSGAGLAVIRIDVSMDGGQTWQQAEFQRASGEQTSRSNRAWAWVQWKLETVVPLNAPSNLSIVCKAVDDQYNQQPHEPSSIWNIRGILNTSWGRSDVKVQSVKVEWAGEDAEVLALQQPPERSRL